MAKPSDIIEKANSFDNRRRLCLFGITDYRGLRMDGSGAKRERNRLSTVPHLYCTDINNITGT